MFAGLIWVVEAPSLDDEDELDGVAEEEGGAIDFKEDGCVVGLMEEVGDVWRDDIEVEGEEEEEEREEDEIFDEGLETNSEEGLAATMVVESMGVLLCNEMGERKVQ